VVTAKRYGDDVVLALSPLAAGLRVNGASIGTPALLYLTEPAVTVEYLSPGVTIGNSVFQ